MMVRGLRQNIFLDSPGVFRTVLGDGAPIDKLPRGPGEGTIWGEGDVIICMGDPAGCCWELQQQHQSIALICTFIKLQTVTTVNLFLCPATLLKAYTNTYTSKVKLETAVHNLHI